MSSDSESDNDYVPEEPEKVSEEESADDETELQYEQELEHKSKKRTFKQPAKGKKKLKKNGIKDIENGRKEEIEDLPVTPRPEEDKKREDDLWAKFLEGTDTKTKSTGKDKNTTETKSWNNLLEPNKDANSNRAKEREDEKEREKRIFEFAGETIVVEDNVIKERIKTAENTTVSKLQGSSRSRGGGLSNVLGQLNKKNKLSTLEKSKLDWDTFKKDEGIEEEIVNHNKGKAGFLDRRDFLERTDIRQYEIERDLRMSKRGNR